MRLTKFRVALASAAVVSSISVTSAMASTNTITVRPGDSLWKIAHARHISLKALEGANPTVNPWNLRIGTTLRLPSSGWTTQSVAQSSTRVSQQNLYWMEHAINAEAAGESYRAQVAVGDVILHRLYSGTCGKTVRDVVFQVSNGHYQFTSVANGYIYTAPSASSRQAALDVLQNHTDVVPGANVFYNPAKTPSHSWVWSQPTIARIGSFIFAK